MTKKFGILGLMLVAMVGLITPTVASAQERCDYGRYYAPAPIIYHDRYWRENEWRAAREREAFRQREFRPHHGSLPYHGYR